MKKHIGELSTKTAEEIHANMQMESGYDMAIHNGAEELIQSGRGHWVYQTQWASGSTLWRKPNSDQTTIIGYKGKEG